MQEESTSSNGSDGRQDLDDGTEDWSIDWLEVLTDHHPPRDEDDSVPQVEAGDVPTTPDEDDPESDESMNGEDKDPVPPSEVEEKEINRWDRRSHENSPEQR
jgi:hypothetical protein